MERYWKMTRVQLMALAREAGIAGRSRMAKEQLVRALEELSRAVEPPMAHVPASLPPVGGEGPSLPPHPATPDLPGLLGEQRLCLLPQAPRTAYAYWELGEGLEQRDLIFRVLSVAGGRVLLSQGVQGRTGTFYVHLPEAGMEIESSLDAKEGDSLVPLLRSNRIRLPDDSPSEEVDTLWMTRRREYEEIFRLSGGGGAGQEAGAIPYGGRRPGVPVSSWPGGGRTENP